MEIYKDLSSPASQQFEKLLNTQLSKNKIEEGKIIEGKITKITEKYIFLFIPGLKSEPVIDINEMKTIGMQDKVVEGATVPVLLERIEDKFGNVVVSAHKAQKIKGWESLCESYKKSELIDCKYLQRTKGGMIVEHVESKTLCFLPGSQISDSPLKNVDQIILLSDGIPMTRSGFLSHGSCLGQYGEYSKIIDKYNRDVRSKKPSGELIIDSTSLFHNFCDSTKNWRNRNWLGVISSGDQSQCTHVK